VHYANEKLLLIELYYKYDVSPIGLSSVLYKSCWSKRYEL
jgi:hypothetical protein